MCLINVGLYKVSNTLFYNLLNWAIVTAYSSQGTLRGSSLLAFILYVGLFTNMTSWVDQDMSSFTA